jgi:two-component system cell cycle sensor histidine kinase/response regulator CckA
MTCISLNLNQSDPPEPWQGQPEPRPEPSRPGLASILIAEDNDSVLDVTARVLLDAGYDVVAASDGVAALDIIRSQPTLDLLITDIRMPGMGGGELSQKALEHHPDLPIIFISGYPADWNPQTKLGRRQAFLRKPFSADDLLRAVERLLGD